MDAQPTHAASAAAAPDSSSSSPSPSSPPSSPPAQRAWPRRRRPHRADPEFDEVDARIHIPIHTPVGSQLKMQMNRKMNAASPGDGVLQSGISKYRSLQQRGGSGSGTGSGSSPAASGGDASAVDQGLALVDKKQYAAAIPFFTEALKASTAPAKASPAAGAGGGMQSKVRLHYQRGNCYLAAQKYKPAIEDYSVVIGLTPKNAQLFAKRGRAYAALGENHAALLDYTEAINITAANGLLASSASATNASFAGPSDTVAQLRGLYVARAKVYRAMSQVTNALDDLSRAEGADGKRDAELYHLRANLYLMCRQEQPALRDFDRFLELQEEQQMQMGSDSASSNEARRRTVEVLMERARIVQRLAAEEDAHEIKDAEMQRIEQGQLPTTKTKKARGGNSNSSTSSYLGPSRAPTPYKGVQAKIMIKRAIHDYSRVLELDPEHVEALRCRGEAFGHIEHYDEALADFARALEIESNDFEVHMSRAKLYQQQGDLARAISEVTAVLQFNGFFVNGLFYRARLFEEIGELAKAQADYTSIIDAHYDSRGEASVSGVVDAAAVVTTPGGSGSRSSTRSGSSKSPSGRVANAGANGNSTTPGGGGGSVKPGKMISEVTADALLCRARIFEQREKFDAAMADYQQILDSPSKNAKRLDAQLELQSAKEKKALFEERRQREALAWLEEVGGWEDVSKPGSSSGGNNNTSASTSGKAKKKKKKKKKKAKQHEYVLLVDEDDVEIVVEPSGDDEKRDNSSEQEVAAENGGTSEPDAVPAGSIASDRGSQDGEMIDGTDGTDGTAHPEDEVAFTFHAYSEDSPAVYEEDAGEGSIVTASERGRDSDEAPAIPKALGVTRDEALESMWEENDEAIEDRGGSPERVSLTDSSGHDTPAEDERDGHSKHESLSKGDDDEGSTHSTIEDREDEDEVEEEQDGEDTNDSTTESTGADRATIREVLMDEKYLRKRHRQLEKLRASLQRFTLARNKSAIREVLERAQRKQMTESLSDEIATAKQVLDAADLPREQDEHSVTARSEPSRSDDDVAVSEEVSTSETTKHVEEPEEVEKPGYTIHTISPAHRIRNSEGLSYSSSNSSSLTQIATNSVSTTTPSLSPDSSTVVKPPALVIRPIAYNHALQLAEQTQHEMLQHQRLVQEKDAEIAYLKHLLAQSRQAEAFVQFDELEREPGFHSWLVQLRSLRFPQQSLGAMKSSVDELIDWMGPTGDADFVRQKILAFVQRVLEAHFPPGTPLMFYPMGSFPMKTYLPTADLDICLLLPKELEPSWYFAVMHALSLAGSSGQLEVPAAATGLTTVMSGSPTTSKLPGVPTSGSSGALMLTNTVRNVSFINADVRVIKCTIDNVAVDLTANRVAALGAVLLLDAMDARVGQSHLLKKSLIVIKAWCCHESAAYTSAESAGSSGTAGGATTGGHQSVMGASHGAFSTYAINTIVMALFNQYGESITHPLQALYLFLDCMADFPWHEAAMSLYGPVPLSVLATTPLSSATVGASSSLKKSRAKSYTFGEAVAGSVRAEGGAGGNLPPPFEAVMESEAVAGIRMTLLEQFSAFDASLDDGGSTYKPLFPVRVCNIVDPLDEKNNLARSVSADWFPIMKRAFRLGRNRLAMLLSASGMSGPNAAKPSWMRSVSAAADDSMSAFFAQSWKLYGRGDGWRPDLLVHPRQTWHGKATLNGVDGLSAQAREQMRWESLLPAPPASLVPPLFHPAAQPYYASPHHGHPSPITLGAAGGPAVNGPPPSTFYPPQRRPFPSSNSAKSSPQRSGGADTKSGANAAAYAKPARRYDSPPPYSAQYPSR